MSKKINNNLLHHLELTKDPIRFATNKTSTEGKLNYYFDISNSQFLVVSIPPTGGINVTKINTNTKRVETEKFNVKLHKDVTQIANVKYSYDEKFIAIQTSPTQIDFINLQDRSIIFSQACKKSSNNQILDFFWTYADNLFFITTNGLELYQFPLQPKKKELKLLKDQKTQVNWFIYSSKQRALLVSFSGPLQNVIQGYHFVPNSINKLPKFTIDKEKTPLKQNELVVAHIYGKLFCIHINSAKQELEPYQLTRDLIIRHPPISVHTSGQIALHVIDNLLIVHNIDSKVPMVFDLNDADSEFPVAAPLPMAPFINEKGEEIALYPKHWQFYSPNFILDTEEGYIWDVRLDLSGLAQCFADKKKLVDFLMKRSHSSQLVLSTLRNLIEECESLSIISEIFDMLNYVLNSDLESGGKGKKVTSQGVMATVVTDEWGSHTLTSLPGMGEDPVKQQDTARRSPKGYLVIDQNDMYRHVFSPVEEHKGLDYKFVVAVITEYIRSLNYYHLVMEPFLYELLIHFLVRNNRFYQLHQLLQYHVVSDSVPVACQLLSLESTYPPAYQLALDMFKRLHTHDQIVEVLLTKHQVLPALRFMRSYKGISVSAARFLETAMETGDKSSFFTVYKYFEERGDLVNSDCAKYVKYFKDTFQ